MIPAQITVNAEIALTPFQPEDKPTLVQYLNDPVLYQNTLTVPSPYTAHDADDWLSRVEARRLDFGMETDWVIRRHAFELMGGIGRFVKSGVEGHSDEIGYWLAAPFRGQGIMSAVVVAYCNWLFENTPLVRIEANAFPFNPASIRVLEKSGFDKEGYARKKHCKNGQFIDSVLMAKIKTD